MKKLINRTTRGLKASLHVVMASFVLVLPLGYYPYYPDSGGLSVGVHGGLGQVASVLRDCSGKALHTESSTFKDVSGIASWGFTSDRRTTIAIGVRGGYWEASKARFAQYDSYGSVYGSTPEIKLHFAYLNPNFSVEGEKGGFGFGLILGQVPIQFGESDKIPVSAHVRVGNLRKGHVISSFAENTPLISGGGLFNLGFGYPAGKNVRMFSGLTAGFYDQAGFLQQAQFRINRRLDADLSIRLGGAGSAFEGSASGGLIYRIGGK